MQLRRRQEDNDWQEVQTGRPPAPVPSSLQRDAFHPPIIQYRAQESGLMQGLGVSAALSVLVCIRTWSNADAGRQIYPPSFGF